MRYAHLLSGEPQVEASSTVARPPAASAARRIDTLERQVASLETELTDLRNEFEEFRRSFH